MKDEKREEVHPQYFRVTLPCSADDCDGEMESDGGMVYTTNPAQYPHKCSKCEETRTFTTVYPFIEVEYSDSPTARSDTGQGK